MGSADAYSIYACANLFSQNERASANERVSFVKTD